MPKKGYKQTQSHRDNVSASLKGKSKSKEHCRNIAESYNSGRFKKGQHISPLTEFKKGQTSLTKGLKRTKESIDKQKETIRNRTEEEKRIVSENVSKVTRGKHHSPKTEFTSERVKEMHKNGTFEIPSMLGKHQSKRQKEMMRGNTYFIDAIKKNPEILKKMLVIDRPNYRELQLLKILDNLYPNEWKYVGDGSFIINGKNPDFINCNGKKLIIELFGERWHDKSEEESRKEAFKPYGYNTLIIWVRELRDIITLKDKLSLFMKSI